MTLEIRHSRIASTLRPRWSRASDTLAIIPQSLSSSAQGEGKWLGTEKKGQKRGNNHAAM